MIINAEMVGNIVFQIWNSVTEHQYTLYRTLFTRFLRLHISLYNKYLPTELFRHRSAEMDRQRQQIDLRIIISQWRINVQKFNSAFISFRIILKRYIRKDEKLFLISNSNLSVIRASTHKPLFFTNFCDLPGAVVTSEFKWNVAGSISATGVII